MVWTTFYDAWGSTRDGYTGSYTGAVDEQSRPHGLGTFVYNGPKTRTTWNLVGPWVRGARHGAFVVTGSDGRFAGHVQRGSFVAGRMHDRWQQTSRARGLQVFGYDHGKELASLRTASGQSTHYSR